MANKKTDAVDVTAEAFAEVATLGHQFIEALEKALNTFGSKVGASPVLDAEVVEPEPVVEEATPAKATRKKAAEKATEKAEPVEEKPAPKKALKSKDPKVKFREEMEAKTDEELIKELVSRDYERADVKRASREDLIDTLIADEFDESDEDALESEEVAEEYDRDELMKLTLTNLKKIAKEEKDATTADLKGLDKESVIDIILGEGDDDVEDDEDVEDEDVEDVDTDDVDEDDDEDDEDEDDEDDEDEDDEDGAYTQEDLEEFSLAELKEIATEDFGLTIKATERQSTIIKKILKAQDA